jgi:hypothetical protein
VTSQGTSGDGDDVIKSTSSNPHRNTHGGGGPIHGTLATQKGAEPFQIDHSTKIQTTLHTYIQEVMSSNAITHATVVTLDGTNYELWASQMTSLLQSKGLYKYITERAKTLKEKFADDIEKLEPIIEGDERALGLIKCYMLQGFVDIVRPAKTALEAWESLRNILLERKLSTRFIFWSS